MEFLERIKNKRIYADHASSTPVDRRVISRLKKSLTDVFGNPSAFHQEGVKAKKILEDARTRISGTLGAHPDEILFTSGGTEADNLALCGSVEAMRNKYPNRKLHIVVSAIEHAAIIEASKKVSSFVAVDFAPVDTDGYIDLLELKKLITKDTVCVSVMHANNEIGTVQPIKEISKIIRQERKQRDTDFPIYFHTDACQSFVYKSISVEDLGVDLLTINSSKIYGPKGVGALYKKRNVALAPLFHGGVQEFGLRAGTENVPLIDAFSFAVEINEKIKEKESKRLSKLQTFFVGQLQKNFPSVVINGGLTDRLPNNVNITLPGFSSESLVLYLDSAGISVSEKSACKSDEEESSHVIQAISGNKDSTSGSIRFSFGRSTRKKDIKKILITLKRITNLLSQK